MTVSVQKHNIMNDAEVEKVHMYVDILSLFTEIKQVMTNLRLRFSKLTRFEVRLTNGWIVNGVSLGRYDFKRSILQKSKSTYCVLIG